MARNFARQSKQDVGIACVFAGCTLPILPGDPTVRVSHGLMHVGCQRKMREYVNEMFRKWEAAKAAAKGQP